MTARPLTRAELALHAMDWQARRLFGLGIATVEACGVERPACVSLRRKVTRELLRLSVELGDAEQRIAGRTKAMTQALPDTHRGHRIDAINAGLEGWVPTIDGLCYGHELFPTRSQALSDAERRVNDLLLEEVIARVGGEVPAFPGLRLVHDADRDERMEAGIGRGDWKG